MDDITDISISLEASRIADSFVDTGLFRNKADVLMFAAGFMVKNYYKSFDPETYVLSDLHGSNYGPSTFEASGPWYSVIKALYPETETPRMVMRALMDHGLLLLGQRVKDDPSFTLTDEL